MKHMRDVVLIVNGTCVGVLMTSFTCEELKEIVDRQSPVDVHLYEEIK